MRDALFYFDIATLDFSDIWRWAKESINAAFKYSSETCDECESSDGLVKLLKIVDDTETTTSVNKFTETLPARLCVHSVTGFLFLFKYDS